MADDRIERWECPEHGFTTWVSYRTGGCPTCDRQPAKVAYVPESLLDEANAEIERLRAALMRIDYMGGDRAAEAGPCG